MSSLVKSKRLSLTGGRMTFSSTVLIPSKPQAKIPAKARYGLAHGSTFLNSVLVAKPLAAGILTKELLFASLQQAYIGAS